MTRIAGMFNIYLQVHTCILKLLKYVIWFRGFFLYSMSCLQYHQRKGFKYSRRRQNFFSQDSRWRLPPDTVWLLKIVFVRQSRASSRLNDASPPRPPSSRHRHWTPHRLSPLLPPPPRPAPTPAIACSLPDAVLKIADKREALQIVVGLEALKKT